VVENHIAQIDRTGVWAPFGARTQAQPVATNR